VIGYDGFSGAVRVVPAAHTASHAGLRGFGAAGVAVAVPRPRRRDLRLAADGGRGRDGGGRGDGAAARRRSFLSPLRLRRSPRLVSHGRRLPRRRGARHRSRRLLALLRQGSLGSSAGFAG